MIIRDMLAKTELAGKMRLSYRKISYPSDPNAYYRACLYISNQYELHTTKRSEEHAVTIVLLRGFYFLEQLANLFDKFQSGKPTVLVIDLQFF